MKRILSLDGGGIRGIFSLQVLRAIEAEFRRETGRPDLVLRDAFDFFAGTSTGAIIATFLAWGMAVDDVEKLYIERGAEMFAKEVWYLRWRAKYRSAAIAGFFRDFFREDDGTPALLGTRKLHDGDTCKYLLVVMRNATTGSPWPVCNNPKAKYNRPDHPGSNLQIPLWQLLRASTAAPTFFPPESIDLDRRRHLFVDGGITPHNNPSLMAALMATLPPYRIDWPTGADQLQVVSVGTGSVRTHLAKHDAERIHLLDQVAFVIPALLESIAIEQDLLCRVIGDCRFGAELDREIGDLRGDGMFAAAQKRFSYIRYNRFYSQQEVDELLRSTQQQFTLDNLQLIPYLQRTGREYAAASVRREHLFA
jgi:hypothetical protein